MIARSEVKALEGLRRESVEFDPAFFASSNPTTFIGSFNSQRSSAITVESFASNLKREVDAIIIPSESEW